jgi:hypothetical protein
MSTYIVSKPTEITQKSPIILGGKVDLYQITSTDPNIDSYVSIDEETGVLTYTGLSTPNISLITIEGSNDNNSWVQEIYAVTPIDISQGTISAGTIFDYSIPNSGTPITIEFTSGGTVPGVGGGYFSVIPGTDTDVTIGTNLTGNTIISGYSLSNTVESYSFEISGINITYPITIGIPLENIDQTRYESLKFFQNVGGIMTELTTSIGAYNSLSQTGFTLTELQANTTVLAVPIDGGFCQAITVYTGNTMNESMNNYVTSTGGITIYVYTQTDISSNILDFWTAQMGINAPYGCQDMTFYGDCNGTPLQAPNFPTADPTYAAGIYFNYEGWFIQIQMSTNPTTGTQVPRLIASDGSLNGSCPGDCQRARQVIPVVRGATLEAACLGTTCEYIVNRTVVGATTCSKKENIFNISPGDTFQMQALPQPGGGTFPPYYFGNRAGTISTAINSGLGNQFFKLGCPGVPIFHRPS